MGTKCTEIEEPPSYEPKILPENVENARTLLGYDNFKKLSSNSATKYPWEDAPDIKYNFKS